MEPLERKCVCVGGWDNLGQPLALRPFSLSIQECPGHRSYRTSKLMSRWIDSKDKSRSDLGPDTSLGVLP
jgi:hypothetical protein